jgi:hypothetical protein
MFRIDDNAPERMEPTWGDLVTWAHQPDGRRCYGQVVSVIPGADGYETVKVIENLKGYVKPIDRYEIRIRARDLRVEL